MRPTASHVSVNKPAYATTTLLRAAADGALDDSEIVQIAEARRLSPVGVGELAKGIGRSSGVVTDEASDLSHTLIQQVFCHQKRRSKAWQLFRVRWFSHDSKVYALH